MNTYTPEEIDRAFAQRDEAVALLRDVPEQPKDCEGYVPAWYWNIRAFVARLDAGKVTR